MATAATVTSPGDLTPVVGANLKRLRVKRGLSLERLAQLSGVSRAMLGQIELGKSTPTINVVWKIAHALGLPFSALISSDEQSTVHVLPAAEAKVLTSQDGAFRSRALFPFDAPRKVEFYELRLAGKAEELAEPHSPGTTENLSVAEGTLELEVDGEQFTLQAGDSILFRADVTHAYRNKQSRECIVYLVMTYAEVISGA